MADVRILDGLAPPSNETPIADGGQHTQAWNAHFQDVAGTLRSVANAVNSMRAGTVLGDDAPAGQIGEYRTIEFVAAVGLTPWSPFNVGTLLLSAGDWDVWGGTWFHPQPTTVVTGITAWVSTSGTMPSLAVPGMALIQGSLSTGGQHVLPTGTARVNVTADTSVFLGAMAGFATAPMTATGFISARRVR